MAENLIQNFEKVDNSIEIQTNTIQRLFKGISYVDILSSSKFVGNTNNSALLFREGLGIPAAAFTVDEYLHGEHLATTKNKMTIILDFKENSEVYLEIIENENQRGGQLILINHETKAQDYASGLHIHHPDTNHEIHQMNIINQIIAILMR